MKRIGIAAVAALALMGLALVPSTAARGVDHHASDHARVVAFWTPERVAKAVPRDKVLNTGQMKAPGKPGDGSVVAGDSWAGSTGVTETTGKVLFSMGSNYYVCSASVVGDAASDRSIVLTAGHCVVDETNGLFAENWMFIPDYDSAPARLTADGGFCASTAYGCWAADFLVASDVFAGAGKFTTEATLHDYGFAVVSTGGLSGDDQLDARVGTQAVQFAEGASGADTYLFGYPAAGRFKGADLVYSRGTLGYDARVDDQTYRVGSSMTGGSSGGPWFQNFDATSGNGTIMSVTSYGYSGVKALFGPKLNQETADMLAIAQSEPLGSGNRLG